MAGSGLLAVHHSTTIYLKRNLLAATFVPHALLSSEAFTRFALDFGVWQCLSEKPPEPDQQTFAAGACACQVYAAL